MHTNIVYVERYCQHRRDNFRNIQVGSGGSSCHDEEFLFGEAEQISVLPNQPLPSGTSHELCLFGFATHVAKYNPDASPTLTALLDIKASIKNEENNRLTHCSLCMSFSYM
jgi:hypothetical protein